MILTFLWNFIFFLGFSLFCLVLWTFFCDSICLKKLKFHSRKITKCHPPIVQDPIQHFFFIQETESFVLADPDSCSSTCSGETIFWGLLPLDLSHSPEQWEIWGMRLTSHRCQCHQWIWMVNKGLHQIPVLTQTPHHLALTLLTLMNVGELYRMKRSILNQQNLQPHGRPKKKDGCSFYCCDVVKVFLPICTSAHWAWHQLPDRFNKWICPKDHLLWMN